MNRSHFLALATLSALACKAPGGGASEVVFPPAPKPFLPSGATVTLIYSNDGRGEIAPCG